MSSRAMVVKSPSIEVTKQAADGKQKDGPVTVSYTHLTLPTKA